MKLYIYEMSVPVEVSLDELAEDLAESVPDRHLIEFILNLDSWVIDLNFTKRLRDRLNEVISMEEDGD